MAFPVSPTNGQTTTVNGINYVYSDTYQSWTRVPVDLDVATISNISSNIGAYQIYANANAATQATSINTINANVGAYQTYANANAATQATSIDTFNANLGAFQLYANTNAASQATSLDTLNANIGEFYNYANTKIGTNTNGNLVIAATTASTSNVTGALVVTGGVGVSGNVFANVLYTTNGIRWAGNGAVFSSGGGGGGGTFTANTAPPTSGNVAGDQWYDTSTDTLFEYINDGDSNQWVDISSPTLYTNNIVTGTSLSITGNGTINDTLTVGNIRTNGLYWSANGYPITSDAGGLPIDFGFVVDP